MKAIDPFRVQSLVETHLDNPEKNRAAASRVSRASSFWMSAMRAEMRVVPVRRRDAR